MNCCRELSLGARQYSEPPNLPWSSLFKAIFMVENKAGLPVIEVMSASLMDELEWYHGKK